MSGVLSKRSQARNEKVLQDLVHSVPGNNSCADCGAHNPCKLLTPVLSLLLERLDKSVTDAPCAAVLAWASWSLGIFLCMRCAAVHRKLGTHISKVKSLSMDSWSNEQVENMKKVGNIKSNKLYNPQNKRPPVPIDVDEADSAMERFIRAKYMNTGYGLDSATGGGSLSSGHAGGQRHNHPRRSSDSDDVPPPLPPKTGKFNLRSASSIFPLSSKARKERSLPPSPRSPRSGCGGGGGNKPSRVFGASVQYDPNSGGGSSQDDTEAKLARLRDMGFADDQRNAIVLKGLNGSLERTVEALVRLGEGGGGRSPGAGSALASPTGSLPPPSAGLQHRTLSRVASSSALSVPTTTTGTMANTAQQYGGNGGVNSTRPETPGSASTNPFDMLDLHPPAQPQSSQSTGTLPSRNPYGGGGVGGGGGGYGSMGTGMGMGIATNNPFGGFGGGMQSGSTPASAVEAAFTDAFGNMSLQQQQQPQQQQQQALFPHHTGGVTTSQTYGHQLQQQQQAPPVPAMPQGYAGMGAFGGLQPQPQVPQQQGYQQVAAQPQVPMQTGYNPFFTQQPQQQQQQPQQQQEPQLSVNTSAAAGYGAGVALLGSGGGSGAWANNPFATAAKSPTAAGTRIQSPLGQIPEQVQQNFFSAGGDHSSQGWNPAQQQPFGGQGQMFMAPPQQQQQQQHQQGYGGQQQPLSSPTNPFFTAPPQPQQPVHQRPDKASIMALYNIPQQQPMQAQQQQQQQQTFPPQQPIQQQTLPAQQQQQMDASSAAAAIFGTQQPARSVSSPLPGMGVGGAQAPVVANNNNPFLSMGGGGAAGGGGVMTQSPAAVNTADPFAISGHRSRDSVMAGGLEWSNGRHSPDAFASLSARH
ncbi:uncharacterized protein E0L32_006312 [Thyridium curvatum]|uniref:Uncharacterized protein n=1 Tax=Thyridium curvatum TaxID=1093900 RepID=A0A507B7F1_9PEZI|nr:uncharacterized protein E0L32_006312 [Thyridium curvatum]TPX13339.1 hypothetical protein E0L32_006312 [Thyridium curvatum]